MSKIDLTSLEWRELVFQGKNKAYGAYQLRGESDKRHNRAMLIVTLVAIIGFSMPKLIEMATPEQKEVNETVTELSQLEKAEVKNDIKKAAEYAFFHIEETPILDQGRTVGYIYVFTK